MGKEKEVDKVPLVENAQEVKYRDTRHLKFILVSLTLLATVIGTVGVLFMFTPLGELFCNRERIVIITSSFKNHLGFPGEQNDNGDQKKDSWLDNFDFSSLDNSFARVEPTQAQCSNPPPEDQRFDCLPERHAAPQYACLGKGCCWKAASKGAPWCFFPPNYTNYQSTSMVSTKLGTQTVLNLTGPSFWPNTSKTLQVDVNYETSNRLHFQIFDPHVNRYRVPIETPKAEFQSLKTDYLVTLKKDPFALIVTRKWSGQVLFNSSVAPLIFADQFIQISTQVAAKHFYGLGEHRRQFSLDTSTFQQMSFWARDVPPTVGNNLYGDHPFFLGMEDDGNAYGVFLLNSNAMDVVIQPAPALTYRTIGGILDFYIFTGPTPAMVVQQYLDVIGYPAMPPYWSLGFHLCRWGYGGIDGMKKVIKRMRDGGFPYDTQWNDIDYMDKHLDWTYDKKGFSGLPSVVKDLHDAGQHYVMIVDPGISNTQPKGSYPPYDDGIKEGVFITEDDGTTPLVGQVWPGYTVYPDFFNPKTVDYWYKSAKDFHDVIPFDGLWTDMNEPSNFVQGSKSGCSQSRLNHPPYTPKILDEAAGGLASKTICPSAKQHISTHYNLHSLYGHSEAVATRRALEKIRNKRPLVITRSSFPSTGKYVGHWTGDNKADWENLYWSIPGILNFQLFGIPLVGADICGFGGETTEELCTRWMQLGAFYPFMRNHNTIGSKDQDPAVFSKDAQKAMKNALELRYTLLPYLYSLFMRSHLNATTVARPLFFNYPKDSKTYSIDRQFMWGDGLLITPVLEKGKTMLSGYFPSGVWYNYNTGEQLRSGGVDFSLSAPLDTINVHVRAGTILPTQPPKNTTVFARVQPFGLIVALDLNGEASGELFWDDGDSLNTTEKGTFTHFGFTAKDSTITHTIHTLGYKPTVGLGLGNCKIFGVTKKPTTVLANGQVITDFTFSANNVLEITGLTLDLTRDMDINWK